MSDFEDQLRQRLGEKAAVVSPRTDLEDLVGRIAHDRSRGRRLSAFAFAFVVIAGPLAGFGVARASARPAEAASRRSAKVTTPTTRASQRFTASNLPVLKSSAAPTLPGSSALISPVPPPVPSGVEMSYQYGDLSLGRMFARDSSDGIDLRVYGAQLPSPPSSVPWWTAPPFCFPNRLVQVDASNDLVAGSTQGYLYQVPLDHLVASVSMLGTNEGSPLWIAVVQSDEGTTARATFADGASDSAPLQDGVAVLGHAVGSGVDRTALDGQALHVEILDAAGSVVVDKSITVPGSLGTGGGAGEPAADPADCTAPTTLPAPGAQQPSDVAAATAGVTQAFTDVLSGTSPVAVREAAIDNGSDLDSLYSQLLHGSVAAEVKEAVPHVNGVVFLSATEAAVAYDVFLGKQTDLSGQFGEAVFVDGRWKVSRATFCTEVAMAGLTCPP